MTRDRLTNGSEGHVLDEGLPPGQTRDGVWNTNNFVESAFRVFNAVFLENRRNKRCVADEGCSIKIISRVNRIDRLLTIILEDLFTFYRLWPPRDMNVPADLVRKSKKGHDIWASGHVSRFRLESRISGTNFEVIARSDRG